MERTENPLDIWGCRWSSLMERIYSLRKDESNWRFFRITPGGYGRKVEKAFEYPTKRQLQEELSRPGCWVLSHGIRFCLASCRRCSLIEIAHTRLRSYHGDSHANSSAGGGNAFHPFFSLRWHNFYFSLVNVKIIYVSRGQSWKE